MATYARIKLYCGPDESKAAMLYDIYTFQKFGEYANNNKLISYEEAMKYQFEEKKQRELPTHITFHNGYYVVRRIVEGTQQMHCFKKLDEAIAKLEKLNIKIMLSDMIEEKLHRLAPIRRNKDGIAFVIACDGRETLISDEDWHDFSRHSWYVDNYGYALNGHRKKMHKLVVACDDKDKVVHHINSNTLDNRRQNLTIATRSENAHQKLKQKNASSKYFGVCYLKGLKKWQASFYKGGVKYYVGVFDTEREAALAYNAKALEIYGKFANLNVDIC